MRTWLRGKFTLLFMTCAVVLAIPATALADNTIADGDGLAPLADNNMALGSVCSGVESSKSAPVFINRNGSGTQVFANSSTATVTITSVTGAGLSAEMGTPNTITLPSDWSGKANNTQSASVSSTVKLNSSVAGPGSGSVTYAATGKNAAGTTITRSDTMNVSWTTANCDTTAPVITPDVQGTLGNNGWYTSDVDVSWSVVDNESTISSKSASCDTTTTINTDTTGQTVSCTATSAGGTDTKSVTIKRDATAPTNVAGELDRAADSNGWYNHAVNATFTGDDPTSGIASCSSDGAYSGPDGTGKTVTGSCTDNAGNSANGSSPTFNYDATAPDATADADRSADQGGWYNAPFTVSFSGTDATSGNVSCDPDVNYNGPDTNSDSISGSCTDEAGNSDSATFNFKYDNTDPTINGSASPAANGNGWNNSDVTVSFTCSDATSGVPAGNCPANVVLSEGADQSVTRSVTDAAGNTASDTVSDINIDKTDPNVALNGGPANGQSYYFGSVPNAPTCTASDALSGLAGPCTVSGYGTTVGSHTVTASATDNADNNAEASSTYTVLAWTTKGFYAPVDMGGVYNTVKGGSTVPLKFELFSGATELTDTSAIKSLTATKSTCAAGATEDAIEVTATGGTSLRYDSTGGQFIYNWKTPTGAGCYTVTMTAQDGSTITAYFKSLK